MDINIAADVGAAESVGNFTGNWFCKEGVVHNNFICLSRDLLYHTSSFGPPDKNSEMKEGETEKNEGKGQKALRQVFTPPCVKSVLLCG